MFLAQSGIGESFLARDRASAPRNVGDHHPRPKLIFCGGNDDDLADAARHIANSDGIDWPTEGRAVNFRTPPRPSRSGRRSQRSRPWLSYCRTCARERCLWLESSHEWRPYSARSQSTGTAQKIFLDTGI